MAHGQAGSAVQCLATQCRHCKQSFSFRDRRRHALAYSLQGLDLYLTSGPATRELHRCCGPVYGPCPPRRRLPRQPGDCLPAAACRPYSTRSRKAISQPLELVASPPGLPSTRHDEPKGHCRGEKGHEAPQPKSRDATVRGETTGRGESCGRRCSWLNFRRCPWRRFDGQQVVLRLPEGESSPAIPIVPSDGLPVAQVKTGPDLPDSWP